MNRTIVITILLIAAILGIGLASPVDIAIGARGYGMGGAYAALAKDASASYWNPAGLSFVEHITLMESNWVFQDITGLNVNYIALTLPMEYIGTVSGNWLYKYAELAEGESNTIHAAGEHTFSLSVGRRLWDELLFFKNTAVGLSINRHAYLTNTDNGSGLGFDLGFITELPFGLSAAVVGRNLATDIMGLSINPEVRGGLGYSVLMGEIHSVTGAIDVLYKLNRDYISTSTLEPAKNNLRGFFGLEYALAIEDWVLALRGGANGLRYNSQDIYSYATGAGISYKQYSFQYAFKGDTDANLALGYHHRVDVIINLGELVR